MNSLIKEISYKIPSVYIEGSVPHTHTTTSEIIQTFEDSGKIVVDGISYKMSKTGLYFINGPSPHFVMPDDINKYIHSIAIINTEELKTLCRHLHMSNTYEKIFAKEGGTFCDLTEEMAIDADRIFLQIKKAYYEETDMKYALIASGLVKLLDIGNKFSSSSSSLDAKISVILSYINENIYLDFSLDDLSKSISISKYHMCRIFKDNFGITIGNFILQKRLAIAKQLLLESNYSISKISNELSFSSCSVFSRSFTKSIGCTPSQYRGKYK